MQLDQAAIQLRSREPWEAVDLGAAMLRAWWRPLYGALLAVVLPITLALHLLFASRPWLALLLTWWLKPFYDRVILHVIAHAVFGAPPRVRETLGSLRHLLGSTRLGSALLWGRIDSARAFNLPVLQLEGQRGKSARERRLVLGRRVATQASGVLYMCLLFEAMGFLSLSALVDLMTPATVEAEYGLKAFFRSFSPNADAPGWGVYINHAFYVVAMCAIAPLYVACSFALYLNRRTLLEAWDLELSFRRMAERATASRAASAMLLLTLSALALFALPSAHEVSAAERSPRAAIREVLAAPEFQEYRNEKVWQRRVNNPSETPDWDFGALARLLQFVSDLFAGFVRVAAYTLLAIGAFFLLRHLVRNLRHWRGNGEKQSPRAPPSALFGFDVRPETLPDNLAQVAAAAAESDPRLALSLLYRGALATLIHRDRIDFAAGDTEADCVRRIDRTAPVPLNAYFRRLVQAWSEAAYAQRTADTSSIRLLCEEWQQHFTTRAES